MRTGVRALVALLLLVGTVSAASAQTRSSRFRVDSVGDSTFVFRIGERSGWVRPGAEGMAVDPRQRDALVARFRVIAVRGVNATALVTGQTTFVTREHVAVLQEPDRRFYRRGTFWAGALVGGLVGALASLGF